MQAKSSGSVRRVSGTFGFRPQVQAAFSSARQATAGACRCAQESYVRITLQNIEHRYSLRGEASLGSAVRQEAGSAATIQEVPYRDLPPVCTGNPGGEGHCHGSPARVGEDRSRIATVLPNLLITAHNRDSSPAPSRESHSSCRPAVILGSRGLTDNFITNLNTRKDNYGG
jgi:hypothetical protein